MNTKYLENLSFTNERLNRFKKKIQMKNNQLKSKLNTFCNGPTDVKILTESNEKLVVRTYSKSSDETNSIKYRLSKFNSIEIILLFLI